MPMTERTVALIKSQTAGSVEAVSTVLQLLCKTRDITIEQSETMHLTPEQAEAFYSEHKGRPYYDGLIESVTGPAGVKICILSGPDVISRWRAIIGPTNPADARATAPDSLRARFGTELPNNGFHGSDSPESAAREIAILYPE